MKVSKHNLKKEERIALILDKLAEYYPRVKTGLVYDNPYQLFVATVLSAQTTDEQVNRITTKLFSAVPSITEMSRLQPEELEPYLKSCGLYRQKSRSIIAASRMIVEKYGGLIPDQFDELIKLPGVGRKTANVIISSAFGRPALAVDTHVFRVSKRLGLAEGKTVEIVEDELKEVVPMESWIKIHHRLIAHGRKVCHARKPECKICFLNDLCPDARERGIN